jgi:hypothetical protein
LGKWTTLQRQLYKKHKNKKHQQDGIGCFQQHHMDQLNQIHFDWEATDVSWNAMADRLVAYQRQYQTTQIPAHDGNDRPLAHWVIRQRKLYRQYILNDDDVGENNNTNNNNTFDDLVQRIAQHVGRSIGGGSIGGGGDEKRWKELSPQRIAARICRLNDMGFVWDPLEQQWMDLYERLKDYKTMYGSTVVPKFYQVDPQLGEWVQAQRKLFHRTVLSQQRIERLNSLDFVWDPQEAQWMEMFHRLTVYQIANKTTAVPGRYPDEPDLGNWVSTQRKQYKRNMLSQQRIARLESVQFVWTIQSSGNETNQVA